jgi:hypothetical protein
MSKTDREADSAEFTLPNGLHFHAIPLNVQLHVFPLCSLLASLVAYVSYLVSYLMEGRFAKYFPTISETGVDDFNMRMQSRTFCQITLLCVFVDLYTALHCATFGKSRFTRSLSFVLIVFGLIGMIGCCFCDLKTSLWGHRIVAFVGMSGLIGYQSFSGWLVFDSLTFCHKVAVAVSQIAAWASFVVAAAAEAMFHPRTCITLSTIGEYACVAVMEVYMLSYWNILRSSQLVIVCAY